MFDFGFSVAPFLANGESLFGGGQGSASRPLHGEHGKHLQHHHQAHTQHTQGGLWKGFQLTNSKHEIQSKSCPDHVGGSGRSDCCRRAMRCGAGQQTLLESEFSCWSWTLDLCFFFFFYCYFTSSSSFFYSILFFVVHLLMMNHMVLQASSPPPHSLAHLYTHTLHYILLIYSCSLALSLLLGPES